MDAAGELVEVDSTDEEIVARVAAIDVGKDSGMVCVRVPHQSRPGRRSTRVWTVPARTTTIMALAEQLAEQHIERIVLEATSDYWRPFYYLLEAAGLLVWLVNAREVKNVPGRPKTDKLDAVWLAKLNERGMLRASFVPPVEIRQLRDYTRLRVDLTGERTRHVQRLEKLLEDAPAAQAPPAPPTGDSGTAPAYLAAADRLDEVTGIGRHAAQAIIAEVGLSMAVFPTCGHLVSWAKLSPRTIQSGAKTRAGKTGKGNRYLKAVLGEAAAVAARSNTFLGARYRRLAKRV